ncbi:MAG: enoyl-CoA hydratase/isomerase family protein [Gammaproteobacteria bacterium]|nr:enoyl-CoA hydratase/isomerase family protein [Gammaproteobacteria bacterium]MCH9743775.1 enoyl-CoA hydratase/isomerase family protein [Gammaproteobacteria bacterium]
MSDILFNEIEAKGGVIATITLNRVKALNALSFDMLKALHDKLDQWDDNQNIKAIIIKSNCDRAFCAGGDIKSLYLNRDDQGSEDYFKNEYLCDRKIKHLKTPYISFLDGITMGGGAGISVHGSFRVATNKLMFAMPETAIGFFPDIAAAYFLSNCPNQLGLYMGLTGNSINVTDAYQLKLVTHVVDSKQFNDIEQQLIDTLFSKKDFAAVKSILDRFHQTPNDSELDQHKKMIDQCFSENSVEAIIAALQNSNSKFATETAATLLSRSPTSLKVTFRHFQRSQQHDFDRVIQSDLNLANRFLRSKDFFEGIRAMVIDKDKQPHWRPNNLSGVSDEMVDVFFS